MSCGNALPLACTSCGAALQPGAAFCSSCGTRVAPEGADLPALPPAPTAAAAPIRGTEEGLSRFMPPELVTKLQSAARIGAMDGERRTVTMLFCDVTGSTAAAERLDPEEWTEIMNGAFEHLIRPVYRYEGTLANLMGDAILAFFGAPLAHEDDPERAVLAGLDIIREVQSYKAQVKRQWGIDFDVRVGINTGLVVVGAVGSDLQVQYTAMGDAVNVAARMEQTAVPGTVQISEETQRQVERLFAFEELGGIEVKGKAEPVASYRVTAALARPESIRGIEGLSSQLVGRDEELAELRGAFSTFSSGGGRVISVTGEAGLGKTRLIAELRGALANAPETAAIRWHVGRSLSYETATPYAAVRRILRSLVGLDEDAAAPADAWGRINRFCASAVPGRATNVAPYLAWMLDIPLPADQQDRVAYLEPPQLRMEGMRATVELLESIAAREPLVLFFEDLHWADEASIEVVTELLRVTERSSLVLLLAFRPRRDEGSWQVHETAGRDHPHRYTCIELSPLAQEQTRELVSDGNPFFVEEIVRSMMDDGLIIFETDRWTARDTVMNVMIPDTLSALLTSRLDRLDDPTRAVGQAASVIGRQFKYDELAALLPDVPALDDALLELQRRELVREVARIPKREFAFRHALVQEAAYATILLRNRVQLHAGIADFLERRQPERVEDIADHLVRARQSERAVPYLVAAGERAARSYAVAVAVTRLELAIQHMDDATADDLVRRAYETLGQAKESAFDVEGAAEAYAELRARGEARGNVPMEVSGTNKLAFVRGLFMGDRDQGLADLASAEEVARSRSDDAGLAEACMFQCFLHTGSGEFDEVQHYMQEVIRLGESSGQHHSTLFGMTHLANTLALLTRFDEALDQASKTLARAEELDNLKFQAELLTFVVPVANMHLGNPVAAVEALERGMEIAMHIGDRTSETLAAVLQGKGAMMQGYLEDGLALFRRSMDAADATGIPYMIALSRCVTGTGYLQVGGPMLRRALDLHMETLELMEAPTGKTYGTWLWSEIGSCALSAGQPSQAQELFELALNEHTAPMFLMRPDALVGACQVSIALGQLEDARALHGEAEEYVTSRHMTSAYVTVKFTGARLHAASGEHDAAVALLDECEVLSGSEMRRVLLDVLAARARSLDALGRTDEANATRDRAGAVAEEIAGMIRDDELRSAFQEGTRSLLEPVRA
jgi:class 3 adenylate cyclase/tetratricopeptide (TPR) repeat protein